MIKFTKNTKRKSLDNFYDCDFYCFSKTADNCCYAYIFFARTHQYIHLLGFIVIDIFVQIRALIPFGDFLFLVFVLDFFFVLFCVLCVFYLSFIFYTSYSSNYNYYWLYFCMKLVCYYFFSNAIRSAVN